MPAKKPSRKSQKRKAKPLTAAKSGSGQSAFWNSIIRAAEAEPRDVQTIRGASGIQHPVIAAGVDDKRQRLIIVTKDEDARSAAMMQADIQSAHDSVHVIVARPISWSIAAATRSVLFTKGSEFANRELLYEVSEHIQEQIYRKELQVIEGFYGIANLERHSKWITHSLDVWKSLYDPEVSDTEKLDKLLGMEADEHDRRLGVCPIPLYQLSGNDIEIMARGRDVEAIKDTLLRSDILQYFFPPPDQLALGIIDRHPVKSPPKLVKQVEVAPDLGHPFGPAEITGSKRSIAEMIDELQGRKLLVEGEIGFELTPEGEAVRRTIRFKPREGLLSKLINRFSLNLDLKDLFKGGGAP